jgi:hypothetical protein
MGEYSIKLLEQRCQALELMLKASQQEYKQLKEEYEVEVVRADDLLKELTKLKEEI